MAVRRLGNRKTILLLLLLALYRLTHQARILTLLKLVGVAVLPREESTLGLTFARVVHSPVLRRRAFTLREMDNALEPIGGSNVLLVVVLLLIGNGLLKLHLLLQLLLLVRQNGVFAHLTSHLRLLAAHLHA